MSYSREVYLILLGHAMIEVRATTILRDTEDYAQFCAAVVDTLHPIPTALLNWSEDRASRLHTGIVERSKELGIAETLEGWFAYAERRYHRLLQSGIQGLDHSGERPLKGYSSQLYLRLLERAMEKMKANEDDLDILYAFSDAFHNVPSALCYEWTDEGEEMTYESLMAHATDRGIRGEVEEWMYEIVGEPAKVRAATLPF